MPNNIKVKFQNNFKLYIIFQDKIIFESELIKRKIDFYVDYENQTLGGDNVRYFLLDKDRIDIDLLFKDTGIIATTETIAISDYRQETKIQYAYLKVALLVIIIMIVIIILDNY